MLPQAPPRDLPAQDHEAIDEDERAASRFTTIMGGICAAVIAILMAVLCGELLGAA